MTSFREILAAPDFIGVLTRDQFVHVLNVSRCGCLLETTSPLEAGTVAMLRVSIDGQEYSDDVRVIRCQHVEGAGSTYRVGVEFLWTTLPGVDSLRRILRILPAKVIRQAAAVSMERMAL
jgi:PilZ domain